MTYKKKVLICYSRAGGGHQTMAEILADNLSHDHEVITHDIATDNNLLSVALSQGYVFLTEKTPWLWALLSILWKSFIGMYITKHLMMCTAGKRLRIKLDTHNPDIVISTYYLINTIIKKYRPNMLTYTIVSDIFAVQPIWFFDTSEKYIVMSDVSYQLAIQSGIDPKNVFLTDLIFDSKYEKIPSEREIKNTLQEQGIHRTSVPKILVIGGGSSMPKGYHLVKKLFTLSHPCELYIVCGRNTALKEKILQLVARKAPAHITVHVFGFIDHVRELIAVSDIIISKAGPGIILESLSLQKPLAIYHYIWEQEKPNIEFIVDNKFGIYENNFTKLVHTLNTWLTYPEILTQYTKNISQHPLKNGTSAAITYIKTSL